MSRGERLNIAGAAKSLGVSEKTVRRWIQAGKLPVEEERGPFGRQYFIPADAIRNAQQVLDVVKVERPTDPNTLALAVASALERRDAALQSELAALRQQVGELCETSRAHGDTKEEVQGLRQQVADLSAELERREREREAREAREGESRRAVLEALGRIEEESRRRREWWRFWGR